MIHLTLIGKPLSTSHIYKTLCRKNFSTFYLIKEGKELKESYGWQIKNQYKEEPIKEDIDVVEIHLYFPNKLRRDVDNYNKLILDSANGILWKDDSLIQELRIRKHLDPKNPRVELIIKK